MTASVTAVQPPRSTVPVSSNRRRVAGSVVALVASLALLSGCAGQQTPGSYSDSVKDNFVKGCVTTSNDDAPEGGASFDVQAFCECAYSRIEKNVSFGDFKKVVDDQIEKPSALPASFTEAYADCEQSNGAGAEPAVDSTTTTVTSTTEN